MLRILTACSISLLIYGAAFGWLLDRPLTLGALRARIETSMLAANTISTRKLRHAIFILDSPSGRW